MRDLLNKILFRTVDYILMQIGMGNGSYSISREVLQIKKQLKELNTVIDCGANRGEYTDQILKFYGKCEIHLFEPSNHNIEILRKRFSSNHNVHINQYGLSSINKNSTLFFDEKGSGMASLTKRRLEHFNLEMNKSEKIRLITLDSYIQDNLKNRKIDLLKIDVEGHELDVLIGSENNLKNIRAIQFEFGGCNIDTKTYFQDFWYFFQKHDFDIYRISPLGLLKVEKYKEILEIFKTTNYLAINRLHQR